MNALLKLESFDSDHLLDAATPLDPKDADNLRARAFEEGYGAGWTDALQQMRDEDALRRAAAEEALQGVAFGYHEARAALETTFMELAHQMISTVLPQITPVALRQLLEMELQQIVAWNFAGRLELLCAPGLRDSLSELVANSPGIDMSLLDEPSFSEAQILLRVDQNSRMIDLGAVTAALMDGLAPISQGKDVSNG